MRSPAELQAFSVGSAVSADAVPLAAFAEGTFREACRARELGSAS